MDRRKILLEGLCCANCAAKIEHEVNCINGVQASMNFMNKTLVVETESDMDSDYILNQVKSIVKKHEPDVKVAFVGNTARQKVNASVADKINASDKDTEPAEEEENEEENSLKKQIIQLVIGGLVFLTGVLFSFQNWLELTIFLISYFLVGGHGVLRALREIFRGQMFSENFLMSVATIGAFFVGEYPEGVAVMLFYLVGELFQDMAVDNSRKSIGALMDIRPDYANLKVGEALKKV